MFNLKIILLVLLTVFSFHQCEDSPSQKFDVTTEYGRSVESTTAAPSLIEDLRTLATGPQVSFDVAIGYNKPKKPQVTESTYKQSTTTETHDLSSGSSNYESTSPFPVGYDQHSVGYEHPSTTQADFKSASSPKYDSYSIQPPPLPSQYLETTLSPPVFEHYTTPAKYHNKKEDLYQPTRSPLLNHQSTPITIQYDKQSSTTTVSPSVPPPFDGQYKATPAPLPPQYDPIGQYYSQQNYPSSPSSQEHSPLAYSQAPHHSRPIPPPVPHQYEYYSPQPPIPYNQFLSHGPPTPSPFYHTTPTPYSQHGSSYAPASSSIHSTPTVTPHAEIGTTTPSIYDYSTVAPLQPQYDFIRENYEHTDTSPPPQPYDQYPSLGPPVPPQYSDPSPYITLPNSHNYLDNMYRPYSAPSRKHNPPQPSFEFSPTPHNPSHYIHNIPHYLTPSYETYSKSPYQNGLPQYYKPLYNPYNPSIPQYSPGIPYSPQSYSAQRYAPQLSQYDNYNNYPTIYRPPVPPNYQPHQSPKSPNNLYHVLASKELNPHSTVAPVTEKSPELKQSREYDQHRNYELPPFREYDQHKNHELSPSREYNQHRNHDYKPSRQNRQHGNHELKQSTEYKQHGYHNYQVKEKPLTYRVRERSKRTPKEIATKSKE